MKVYIARDELLMDGSARLSLSSKPCDMMRRFLDLDMFTRQKNTVVTNKQLLCVGSIFIITMILFNLWRCQPALIDRERISTSTTTQPPLFRTNDTLYAIGMHFQTDKATYHRYDVMYERYFKEYRGRDLL
jgi:hypothetical protein